jgi:integrase
MTFRQCAEAYIADHRAGWRSASHASQWVNTLATYAYPVIGDLPVAAVDVGLVLKILQPIWQVKTETASRLRGRIESVLDWAAALGYRSGENPALWRGRIANLLTSKRKLRQVRHLPALPYGEIGAFMAALRAQEGIAARALELLILTAARRSEVIGATWSEIDLPRGIWTLAAARMKGGRQHRVPLAPPAVAILEWMSAVRLSDFVFPGLRAGRPLDGRAMLDVVRRLGRKDITAHGFRSTFRSWAAEQTNYPREVCEMALAHAARDAVEVAYQRGDLLDKRRKLMEAWAGYCAQVHATDNVIAIRPGC